jgi:hypothetical protein
METAWNVQLALGLIEVANEELKPRIWNSVGYRK